MHIIKNLFLGALLVLSNQVCFGADLNKAGKSPLDELPGYIRQVTYFGERADWSLDGKNILFLSKTFGDVFEVEVATDSSIKTEAQTWPAPSQSRFGLIDIAMAKSMITRTVKEQVKDFADDFKAANPKQ